MNETTKNDETAIAGSDMLLHVNSLIESINTLREPIITMRKNALINSFNQLGRNDISEKIVKNGLPNYIFLSPDLYLKVGELLKQICPTKEHKLMPTGNMILSWHDQNINVL